jgi:hypothetical protein
MGNVVDFDERCENFTLSGSGKLIQSSETKNTAPRAARRGRSSCQARASAPGQPHPHGAPRLPIEQPVPVSTLANGHRTRPVKPYIYTNAAERICGCERAETEAARASTYTGWRCSVLTPRPLRS